ncbi:MAG: response regulator [Clostridiaceae bacterium]
MLKIIIVEDEDIIRNGLVHTIDWLSMGCVVIADAANGQEGLKKILELSPDIVISDIKMPIMNGIDMIKSAMDKIKFKSLLLTSYAEFDYAKKAIELRVSDYLLKPVSEEKIKSSIEKVNRELLGTRKIEESLRKNDENANILNNYLLGDSGKNYYVKISLEKIRDHFAERISIELVAEELGVSASYLSRKFKETTNHTFLELLNEHRIQQSVKLLSTGRFRVSEIGEKVGFNEYKHFYAVFKKYTGLTPSDFAK